MYILDKRGACFSTIEFLENKNNSYTGLLFLLVIDYFICKKNNFIDFIISTRIFLNSCFR